MEPVDILRDDGLDQTPPLELGQREVRRRSAGPRRALAAASRRTPTPSRGRGGRRRSTRTPSGRTAPRCRSASGSPGMPLSVEIPAPVSTTQGWSSADQPREAFDAHRPIVGCRLAWRASASRPSSRCASPRPTRRASPTTPLPRLVRGRAHRLPGALPRRVPHDPGGGLRGADDRVARPLPAARLLRRPARVHARVVRRARRPLPLRVLARRVATSSSPTAGRSTRSSTERRCGRRASPPGWRMPSPTPSR